MYSLAFFTTYLDCSNSSSIFLHTSFLPEYFSEFLQLFFKYFSDSSNIFQHTLLFPEYLPAFLSTCSSTFFIIPTHSFPTWVPICQPFWVLLGLFQYSSDSFNNFPAFSPTWFLSLFELVFLNLFTTGCLSSAHSQYYWAYSQSLGTFNSSIKFILIGQDQFFSQVFCNLSRIGK